NVPAAPVLYTLSLHDALPISGGTAFGLALLGILQAIFPEGFAGWAVGGPIIAIAVTIGALLLRGGKSLESSGVAEQTNTHTSARSEEHTSELQSRSDLVCRLL